MGKRHLRYFTVAGVFLLLSGCNGIGGQSGEVSSPGLSETGDSLQLQSSTGEAQTKVGDASPLSRGLAAKMVALAFNDKNAIEIMEREIIVTDTNAGLWFDKYINAVMLQGLMEADNNMFLPDEALSINQAQNLIYAMNPQSSIKMKITEENKDKSISYALWCQLYNQCLEEMAGAEGVEQAYGISKLTFVVLADSSNNDKLPSGAMIADSGPYSAEGLDFAAYIDKEITVLEKDGEILAILSLDSQTPQIRGAYVVSNEGGKITIFSGGAQRTYNYAGGTETTGEICDIVIDNNDAVSVIFYSENIVDTVKRISDEKADFAKSTTMPVSKDFKVYSTVDGAVKWKNIKNIIVGTDIARLYYADGVIGAAVIEKQPAPGQIRVVIKNTGFQSLVHENVVISGTADFVVKSDGVGKSYLSGEKVYFNSGEEMNTRTYVTCENGRLIIESIERGYGKPTYRGNIEIAPGDGGFVVVNEVNLEEYLYSVVPSEMPISYGLEALKVQAVTARSYAYNQYFANTFHEYGGNVCDSVISQVYNNVEENDASRQAVDYTAGICLTYGGSVISANFFSTSAGVTANNGEVWANSITKQFPADTSPYLVSNIQYTGADYGDLSIEENAAKFFKSQGISAYDSSISWFRWYAEITAEEIAASINTNLKARYEANPKLIKTLQADGIFRSRPVETIGELVNLEITKRGQGGNIMTIKITGTQNTILVNTEYNIRLLIAPKQYREGGESISLTLSDDSVIKDYALMPSAFYAIERMTTGDGKILYVKFYGGGNGHGVGMSQTGVRGMVNAGYAFEEILNHYYPGVAVEQKW